MIALTLATLLASSDPQLPPQTQLPSTAQVAPQDPATDLEDITVVGRPLETMILDFVNQVAAPNRNRGIARWDSTICVGVANLSPEPAQYILDRVSTVAADLGLNTGAPGCTPNVVIIASDQPDDLAQTLVDERRRAFRMGGAGMDQGGDALADFVTSDAPVRWWQQSMPVDAQTGERAVRLSGDQRADGTGDMSAMQYAPTTYVFAASRMTTQINDDLFRTIVILDIDKMAGVSAQQLADYIAMVTLAQIDPKADTSRYASILNVFDDPEATMSLTNWDTAYLGGLYDAERTRANLRSGRGEIAASIQRAHGRLQRTAQD